MTATKKELREDIKKMKAVLSRVEQVLDGDFGFSEAAPEETVDALLGWLHDANLTLIYRAYDIARLGEETAARRAKKEGA